MKPTLPPIDELLPALLEWCLEMERHVQSAGVPLHPIQLADAKVVGVKHPERIRLLMVDRMPHPEALQDWVDWIYFDGAPAICLGYSVLLERSHWNNRRTRAHEMAHTMQFEKLGGIEPFLRTWLTEVTTEGYFNSPMEQEANQMALRVPARY